MKEPKMNQLYRGIIEATNKKPSENFDRLSLSDSPVTPKIRTFSMKSFWGLHRLNWLTGGLF